MKSLYRQLSDDGRTRQNSLRRNMNSMLNCAARSRTRGTGVETSFLTGFARPRVIPGGGFGGGFFSGGRGRGRR